MTTKASNELLVKGYELYTLALSIKERIALLINHILSLYSKVYEGTAET